MQSCVMLLFAITVSSALVVRCCIGMLHAARCPGFIPCLIQSLAVPLRQKATTAAHSNSIKFRPHACMRRLGVTWQTCKLIEVCQFILWRATTYHRRGQTCSVLQTAGITVFTQRRLPVMPSISVL